MRGSHETVGIATLVGFRSTWAVETFELLLAGVFDVDIISHSGEQQPRVEIDVLPLLSGLQQECGDLRSWRHPHTPANT